MESQKFKWMHSRYDLILMPYPTIVSRSKIILCPSKISDILGPQLLNIYGATFNVASLMSMESNTTELSFTQLLNVSNNDQLVCEEKITRSVQLAKPPKFGW